MKKITFSLLLCLFAFSCTEDVFIAKDSVYKSSIENYFELLKNSSKANIDNISQLAELVDYKKVSLMNLRTTEKLIVADLKENLPGFENANTMKVIFYLNQGEIVRSNLITFKNTSNQSSYTQVINSVINLNGKESNYSGTVSFYATTSRRILFENVFENGLLKATKAARPKIMASNNGGKTNGCTDYYWVTSIDGIVVSATYLFTTCDCQSTQKGKTDCGGGGDDSWGNVNSGAGGGPGSGNEPNLPANPQPNQVYEFTDRNGKYTKYMFNSALNGWVTVYVILPTVTVVSEQAKYPFLQFSWPSNGQTVLGPDGMIYTYEGADYGRWVGLLYLVPPPPEAKKIPNRYVYLKCFDLSKPAKLTIYADQPLANTPVAYMPIKKVGHSWISITQSINGVSITRTFGFYPANGAYPDSSGSNNTSDVSVLVDDSGHEFDVSISFDITQSELTDIINYTISQMPAEYDLDTFNCTNFAVNSCGAAGIPLPQNIVSWGLGSGLSPGRFGQDLRTHDVPNKTETRNLNGGNAPANTGNCD